jgi:hypothetical protein
MVKSRSRKRRSPPSKGWKNAAPKPGKARDRLLAKCGKKCFLRPSDKGFAICTMNCKPDCRGLAAAKARAGQYKHSKIEAAAQRKEKV